MKTKFAIGIAVATLLCAFLARPLWSGDKDGPAPAVDDRMKPGPEHEGLTRLAGKWEVVGKFWMGDPKTDGQPIPGAAEFKVILDGRYVQQDFTSEFMGKYVGMGVMGYDRYSKKYTLYWNDNMSTMPQFMQGTSKDGGKTIEYAGEMPNPMGEGTMKYRTVLTTKSDTEVTYEMFEPVAGKDTKTMEIAYTRKN